jgi:hypothetical protein
MDHTTLIRRPRLRGPVLLAAFDGWNDAGEAATTALDAIGDALAAETFATIDPEEFFDFQATRPTVRLVDGYRRVEWPAIELRAARLPAEVLGTIADDPKAARLLSGRWTGRLGGSLLVRSARQLAAQLHARVADQREMAG